MPTYSNQGLAALYASAEHQENSPDSIREWVKYRSRMSARELRADKKKRIMSRKRRIKEAKGRRK